MAEIDYIFRLSVPGTTPYDMTGVIEDVLQDALEQISLRIDGRHFDLTLTKEARDER